MTSSASYEQLGREVIQLEAEALQALAKRIDGQFAEACRLILAGTGRVIVTGMGKSRGTSAARSPRPWPAPARRRFSFIRARRAHGDVGMITTP